MCTLEGEAKLSCQNALRPRHPPPGAAHGQRMALRSSPVLRANHSGGDIPHASIERRDLAIVALRHRYVQRLVELDDEPQEVHGIDVELVPQRHIGEDLGGLR